MSCETTALVVRELDGNFALVTIKVGALQPSEVLVEIQATGVCHTDIKCATGGIPVRPPMILGHEGGGVVVDTGSEVVEVTKGDKVLLSYTFCDECNQCNDGYKQYCESMFRLNFGGHRNDGTSAYTLQDGSKLHGHFFGQSSFSRLAVVSRNSVVKVSHDIPLELFAPLGCGMQTGAGAVLNSLNIPHGSTIAIFGVGSVGMSAVMAARMRQAKEIIAVDIQSSRLEKAKELGATQTINSVDTDVLSEMKKICPNLQFAVDCSGVVKVVEIMIQALGLRGRACSAGAPSPGLSVSVEVISHAIMGKHYIGTHQGDSIAREMIPFLIDQHAQGNYPLEKIITRYNIKDYATALKDMRDGRTIKPVLVWE